LIKERLYTNLVPVPEIVVSALRQNAYRKDYLASEGLAELCD